MSTGLVYDERYLWHYPSMGHPERPERLEALMAGLHTAGLLERLVPIPARPAGREELERVHDPDYLDLARWEIVDQRRPFLSTGDTEVCPDTWEVALQAAGGVLAAVDAVASGDLANAFCAVRPPGHHATPDRGMGFCVLNNVALAARHAQQRHGLERVLVVDWDVHHGNGTQETFYREGSVFYFSTHQWPFYPGTGSVQETGEGPGAGTTLNIPLPAGSGDTELLAAFTERLQPAAEAFRPDLVLISAGFDARTGDLLGGLEVTDEGFVRLTRIVQRIAAHHAGGRIVSVLEGGYTLAGLASTATAHLRCLLEG
jgi:acetoin utilization deacetylase AcuC-like enzyme